MKKEFRKVYQIFRSRKLKFDVNSAHIDSLIRQEANIYLDRLKRNIIEQNFEGKGIELSTSWKNTKAKKGYDSRVLISTGEYLKGLTVSRTGKSSYFAGPDYRRVHRGSGLRFSKLAYILEYGNEKNPARPHLFEPIEQTKERRDALWIGLV